MTGSSINTHTHTGKHTAESGSSASRFIHTPQHKSAEHKQQADESFVSQPERQQRDRDMGRWKVSQEMGWDPRGSSGGLKMEGMVGNGRSVDFLIVFRWS